MSFLKKYGPIGNCLITTDKGNQFHEWADTCTTGIRTIGSYRRRYRSF